MKTEQKPVKTKFPAIRVRVDKALDKYDDVVLFPKKVEKAKEALARFGVPDWSEIEKGE